MLTDKLLLLFPPLSMLWMLEFMLLARLEFKLLPKEPDVARVEPGAGGITYYCIPLILIAMLLGGSPLVWGWGFDTEDDFYRSMGAAVGRSKTFECYTSVNAVLSAVSFFNAPF